MQHKQAIIRCNDGQEAAVFSRYDFDNSNSTYEMSFEDSYIGGNYKGFIRFVTYVGIRLPVRFYLSLGGTEGYQGFDSVIGSILGCRISGSFFQCLGSRKR